MVSLMEDNMLRKIGIILAVVTIGMGAIQTEALARGGGGGGHFGGGGGGHFGGGGGRFGGGHFAGGRVGGGGHFGNMGGGRMAFAGVGRSGRVGGFGRHGRRFGRGGWGGWGYDACWPYDYAYDYNPYCY
jgi:hypothetical protein